MKKHSFFIFFCFWLLLNCTSNKKSIYTNNENLYKKNNQELGAEFISYHTNDSITKLFFKIPNQNLIYKRPDTSNYFFATFKLKYFLFGTSTSKQLLDSGSILIYDRQKSDISSRDLEGNVSINMGYGKNYSCEIHVYDLNKKSKSTYVVSIDKSTHSNRNYFIVQDPRGRLIYNYYLQTGDTVLIHSNIHNQADYSVDLFRREFPLAPPPFSEIERTNFKYQPDSSFNVINNYGLVQIIVPKRGFYHVLTNSNEKEGLTLYAVESSFPGIKNEVEMIKSTRYIMSKKEYENALNSSNKKQAIDDFWLDLAGSNERAKELLKKYYSRVKESNKLFTSYQPGWQTDRGMVYIVFGAPNTMYKFQGGETWIYGLESQPGSVRFNFKKVSNPFSDNDFTMERNEYYKDSWYRAVDYWRQGRIFLDN